MKAFRKDRLHTLITVLLVLSVSTSLFSSHIYYRQKHNLISNYQSRINIESELISAIITDLISRNRPEDINNTLHFWANSHRHVVLLELISDTGKTLFSYHNSNTDGNEYVITNSIPYKDHNLNLALAHNSKNLFATLAELRNDLILLTAFLILFIGLTLWFILFRWLIKPMRLEIHQQTQILRDMVAYTEGLFNAMNAHIAVVDSNGIIISTNRAWHKFAIANDHGHDPAMIGESYFDLAPILYKAFEYSTAWKHGIQEVTLGLSARYVCEYSCQDQGKQRWFIMRTLPVSTSNPPLVIVTHEDITCIKESQFALIESEWNLRQINKVYRALSSCNIMLLTAKEENALVMGIANIIYENCGHISVWIGYALDNATKDVQPIAFKGHDPVYIEALDIGWGEDCERGQGPVGISIRERRPVVTIHAADATAIHSPKTGCIFKTQRGLQNCAVLPMVHDSTCLGAIIIHTRSNEEFSEQEIHLFTELAANLAFGILAIRNSQAKEQALLDLDRLSITDKLTQLYNRTKLDDVLEQESKRSQRYNVPTFAIILSDIDFFKNVNDTYGHQAGDKTLIEFAAILRQYSRNNDIVGRWGGEEFLIICPHTDGAGAVCLAEKIRSILEKTIIDTVGIITASFGVAEFTPSNSDDVDKLLGRADKALYIAKKLGRNQVQAG